MRTNAKFVFNLTMSFLPHDWRMKRRKTCGTIAWNLYADQSELLLVAIGLRISFPTSIRRMVPRVTPPKRLYNAGQEHVKGKQHWMKLQELQRQGRHEFVHDRVKKGKRRRSNTLINDTFGILLTNKRKSWRDGGNRPILLNYTAKKKGLNKFHRNQKKIGLRKTKNRNY